MRQIDKFHPGYRAAMRSAAIRIAEENPRLAIWRGAQQRAKQANMEFTLEVKDIVIPSHCPYLGIALTFKRGEGRRDNSPALDRVDNTRGYTKDNIQVISNLANCMKNSATLPQLITFARSVLRMHTTP